MKNAISALRAKKDDAEDIAHNYRTKEAAAKRSADSYQSEADEYQRAIDLLEAAAATLTEPQS